MTRRAESVSGGLKGTQVQRAVVIGKAVSSVKHPSMEGVRMLLVQPLNVLGGADAEPILAADILGSSLGSKVLLTSDGKSAREVVDDKMSPVRYWIFGLEDES